MCGAHGRWRNHQRGIGEWMDRLVTEDVLMNGTRFRFTSSSLNIKAHGSTARSPDGRIASSMRGPRIHWMELRREPVS